MIFLVLKKRKMAEIKIQQAMFFVKIMTVHSIFTYFGFHLILFFIVTRVPSTFTKRAKRGQKISSDA